MLDIQAIRRALAAQIKAGITRTPNVYAYLPDDPQLPCVGITADDPYVSYFTTLGGDCNLRLFVRICASGRAEDSLIFLDDLLSQGATATSSVVDVIIADKTLGGLVEECLPRPSRMVPEGEQDAAFFEAVIPVEIWLRAT